MPVDYGAMIGYDPSAGLGMQQPMPQPPGAPPPRGNPLAMLMMGQKLLQQGLGGSELDANAVSQAALRGGALGGPMPGPQAPQQVSPLMSGMVQAGIQRRARPDFNPYEAL